MLLIFTILALALAFACFIVATAVGHSKDGEPWRWTRINWMALGLAVWVSVQLVVNLVAK